MEEIAVDNKKAVNTGWETYNHLKTMLLLRGVETEPGMKIISRNL